MKKLILFFVGIIVTGGMGPLDAKDVTPVAGSPHVSSMEQKHPMIFELNERIKSQNDRIDEGLYNYGLSYDQGKACRDVLESVEKQMKADYKAHGSKKLTREEYNALNNTLDVNSDVLHEQSRYFYSYEPYYHDYVYKYDYPYFGYSLHGPTVPKVSAEQEAHPMIFELKDRIKNQRERIDQGLKDKKLTENQAEDCRGVVKSVENQMKADYKANGPGKKMKLTRAQYDALNTSLDLNSSIIKEEKEKFFFYDPYFSEYY